MSFFHVFFFKCPHSLHLPNLQDLLGGDSSSIGTAYGPADTGLGAKPALPFIWERRAAEPTAG